MWEDIMIRKKFLEDMLSSMFGVKCIEYKKEIGCTLYYMKGGTLCKDCTYSSKYKSKFMEFWDKLLNEKYNFVIIDSNINKKYNIEEYHEKARNYVFRFSSVKSEQDSDKLKEVIPISMVRHIYLDIILEELFNIGEKKSHKDRGGDDFEDCEERIKKQIDEFLVKNWDLLGSKMYKNSFFKDLVKKCPVFVELQLDENEETVIDDIKKGKEFFYNFKIISRMTASDLGRIVQENRDVNLINKDISVYCDKVLMEDEDFKFLAGNLEYLLNYSERYIDIFCHKEDIEELKNTAVRLYNYFYGKNHPKYTGSTQREYWNAHTVLIEYLFMLDLVLKAFDEKENKRQNTSMEDNSVK